MVVNKYNTIWGPEKALNYSTVINVVQKKASAGLREGSLLLLL